MAETFGLLTVLGCIFLVALAGALAVAPFKLYGIHDELRKANRTLTAQNQILTAIATELHFGAMHPAPANVAVISPAPSTPPAVWELPRSPRDLA
jgi:hypothetical protein